MCLKRYGLDTKRTFWRRYDDVNPERQIYFHFYSKSAIKNALEQVLGHFTSNPEQVKKINFWGTGKFQDPLLENSRTQPVTWSWIFLSTIHRHLSQSRFCWENLLRYNPLFILNSWSFSYKGPINQKFFKDTQK